MSLRDWYFCYLIKELKKKEMEKTFWRWKLNVNQDAKTMRTQFSQTTISQRKYVKLHHIILRYSVKSCIKRPIFENPILGIKSDIKPNTFSRIIVLFISSARTSKDDPRMLKMCIKLFHYLNDFFPKIAVLT